MSVANPYMSMSTYHWMCSPVIPSAACFIASMPGSLASAVAFGNSSGFFSSISV